MLDHSNPVFLDLETTNVYGDFCELGVVSADGGVLINTLAKPKEKISPGAQQVHGISNDDVADAPASQEVLEDFLDLVAGKTVGVYNAPFDTRFLPGIFQTADVFCVLELARKELGLGRKKGEATLSTVAGMLGIEWPEGEVAHRAAGDAIVTAQVFQALLERNPKLNVQAYHPPEDDTPDPTFENPRKESAFFSRDPQVRESFRNALFVGFTAPFWLKPKSKLKAAQKRKATQPFARFILDKGPKFRRGPFDLYALHELD